MLDIDFLSVNGQGHLMVEGCDTVELAHKYGTPLYVMNETTIRKACREYISAINDFYEGKGNPIFAGKSLCCLEICRIMKSEKMGLDVVSGGELYTAIKASFPPNDIYFHGSNKSYEELSMALDQGVGRIVVDNIEELYMINGIASQKGVRAQILLRIRPGIEVHTHSFIRTGQLDSKFGFSLETGEAIDSVKKAIQCTGIEFMGIHCHIGSQIVDKAPFVYTAGVMMDLIGRIRTEIGVYTKELNLGGGFGIQYANDDEVMNYRGCIKDVSEAIKKKALEYNVPVPYIFMEPGRSIVGPAGLTLYATGTVREIPGIRTYVSVDGGMSDNPRYALYKSKYSVINASRAGEEPDTVVTIAGKCCESGDIIQEDIKLKKPRRDDILAVLCTGAYNYSMASNYNRLLKPAMIMVNGEEERIIIRRQSLDDLVSLDI